MPGNGRRMKRNLGGSLIAKTCGNTKFLLPRSLSDIHASRGRRFRCGPCSNPYLVPQTTRDNIGRGAVGGFQPNSPSAKHSRERLKTAFELYPCDVLFVHRDAEGQSSDLRSE